MNYPRRLLRIALDLLLPRETTLRQLEEMSVEEFLEKVPRNGKVNGVESLFQYRHPLMRCAIWEIKYRNNRIILDLVAEAAAKVLIEKLSLQPTSAEFIFIPVPLSARRLKERGYNQAEEIAETLVKKFGARNIKAKMDASLVEKIRHTEPQAETHSRKERLNNLKMAFRLTANTKEKIAGKNIILIDDVTTTGTTLKEVAALLLPFQPQNVILLAVAH